MNNIILTLVLNSVLILNVLSAPGKNSIIFDQIQNDIKTCPLLNKYNITVEHSKTLSYCTDFPNDNLNDYTREKYLCVGVLDSYLNLCKRLSKVKKDDVIPPFNLDLKSISECYNTTTVCSSLQKYTIADGTKWTQYMVEFDNHIKNATLCKNLCTSVSGSINDLCSVICEINVNIKSIETFQHKSNVEIKALNTTLSVMIDSLNVTKKNETSITDKKLISPNDQSSNVDMKTTLITDISISNENVQKEIIKTKKKDKPQVATSDATNKESVKLSSTQSVDNKSKINHDIDEKSQNQPSTKKHVEESITKSTAKVKQAEIAVPTIKKPEKSFDDTDLADNEDFENKEDDRLPDISPVDKQTPNTFEDSEESNFFSYFMLISVVFIVGYVIYHNKQKILALVLEGRKDRNSRRRPNTAGYRKLDSNLEEAVTSKSSGSAAHVIY